MFAGGAVDGGVRRKAKVVKDLLWRLGCWRASFENGGEAMLAGLGCGGEGSGGLVELFGGVVGVGDLVVGVVFGSK